MSALRTLEVLGDRFLQKGVVYHLEKMKLDALILSAKTRGCDIRSSVKLIEEIKDLLERNPNRESIRYMSLRFLLIVPHLYSILAIIVFMGKEDRNCIPKHILSLVEDFDSWNDYPWGEYMWEIFYKRTVNVVAIHRDSNPNLELYATLIEKQTGWFIASIQFINGLVDEDLNVSQDDGVGVVLGNCVDLQHNSISAVSVLSANSHEGLNKTRVANNKMLLLEGGDGCFDSEGGATNPESNKDKPPTLADVLDEVRALRKEVALVNPNGNHNVVNQGLSGSANHLMSTCSRPDIDNGKVAGHIIGIHKADGKNDSLNGNQNGVKKGLSSSANDPLSTCSGAHILDGEVVGALIGIHKPTCSSPDMDNGKVVVAGMVIHKADRQNDIPNANDNVVNQGIIVSANDPMLDVLIQVACDGLGIDKADGNNDYTGS
ncbi:hypothetical protein Tco_1376926 [Tanacetum coccineum]